MASIQIWVQALRLPFLTASLVPVVVGSAISHYSFGEFSWLLFVLTLLGVCLLQLGTNLSNDYHDQEGDALNKTPTPFSGGSRVIQKKLLTPNQVKSGFELCFGLAIIIGGILFLLTKNVWIVGIGAIGMLLGYFYTARPVQLGYKGYGDLIVFLSFGPLAIVGTVWVQSGEFSLLALLGSVPIGILTSLILVISGFQDYEADKKINKKTLALRLGKRKASELYVWAVVVTYLFVNLAVILSIFPLWSLLTLLTLPVSMKAVFVLRQYTHHIEELIPANKMTVTLHLLFGLFFALSFLV